MAQSKSFGNSLKENVLKFEIENSVVHRIDVVQSGTRISMRLRAKSGKQLGDEIHFNVGGGIGLDSVELDAENKRLVFKFQGAPELYCDLSVIFDTIQTIEENVTQLADEVATKQDKLTPGENIEIIDNVISAKKIEYQAGDNITIDENNTISATDTTYTAGEGISISEENVISVDFSNYYTKTESNELFVPKAITIAGLTLENNILKEDLQAALEDSDHRFVTDAQIDSWTNKQDKLPRTDIAGKVLTSTDTPGEVEWRDAGKGTLSDFRVNNISVVSGGEGRLETDKQSILYEEVKGTRCLKLPDDWSQYLKKQTFKAPSITVFNVLNEQGVSLEGERERGFNVTVSKIRHCESNIQNLIEYSLKVQIKSGADKLVLVPSTSATVVDVEDDVVDDTTKTYVIEAKYEDVDGIERTITRSASISRQTYVYSKLTNSEITPTEGGVKHASVSSFSSGATFTYTQGQYLYFFTLGTGKTIQQNVFGTWYNVETVEIGEVPFKQANGAVENFIAYRTLQFTNSGTAIYRI